MQHPFSYLSLTEFVSQPVKRDGISAPQGVIDVTLFFVQDFASPEAADLLGAANLG